MTAREHRLGVGILIQDLCKGNPLAFAALKAVSQSEAAQKWLMDAFKIVSIRQFVKECHRYKVRQL